MQMQHVLTMRVYSRARVIQATLGMEQNVKISMNAQRIEIIVTAMPHALIIKALSVVPVK